METNPYITVTGCVSKFDINDRTFTITPTQYIHLTHTASSFPIQAHFADSNSKKRWGADGPKVTVGTTVSFNGFLERVVRGNGVDKPFSFAQVEVVTIAYLGTHTTLTNSPTGISYSFPDNIKL